MKKIKQNPVIASKILAWQKDIFSEEYLDLKFERLLGCFDVADWKEFLKYLAFRSQEGIEPFAMNLENLFSFECLIESDQENPFETMFSRVVSRCDYEIGERIGSATNELIIEHIDVVPFLDAILKFAFYYLGGTYRKLGSLPMETLMMICESESTSDIAKLRALLLLGRTCPEWELFLTNDNRIVDDVVVQKTECAEKQWRDTILSYRERFKGNNMLMLGLLCLFVEDRGNRVYRLEISEKLEMLTNFSEGFSEASDCHYQIHYKPVDSQGIFAELISQSYGKHDLLLEIVSRCTESIQCIIGKIFTGGSHNVV